MNRKSLLSTATKAVHNAIPAAIGVAGALSIANPALADGLEAGTTLITNFKTWAWAIGPLISSIGGLFVFLGYQWGWVRVEQIKNYIVGLIGVGMVGSLGAMAFAAGQG